MTRLRPDPGLDLFNILLAGAMTGFGAFIPAYLALHAWSQAQIGLALSVQTVAGLLLQVPAGLAVDAARRRGRLLAGAVLMIALAAFVLAAFPLRWPVWFALSLQAAVTGLIYPAIAAISLTVAGRKGLGPRLGRNGSFAALGGGLGAALMGGASTWLGERAVFVFAGAMALAAGMVLLGTALPHPRARHAPAATAANGAKAPGPFSLLSERPVLAYAACLILFNLASAALVPVAATEMTRRLGPRSGLLIAAWIIVPQVIGAVLAPLVGQWAERFGRKPILLVGCATLPLRALLFALLGNPYALAAVQALDGVAGATFGVMTPLVAHDVTRQSNRSSLCLALFGVAGTLGAGVSTTLAGFTASHVGTAAAFVLMAGAGVMAVACVALAFHETRGAEGHA